jgi:hypothetical protein
MLNADLHVGTATQRPTCSHMDGPAGFVVAGRCVCDKRRNDVEGEIAMRLLLVCATLALCSCVVTQAIELDRDLKSADDACRAALASPSLNPIRNKVTLFRSVKDGPTPPSMSSNTSLPSDEELRAISEWRLMRSDCERRQDAAFHVLPSASPRLKELLNYEVAGFRAVRTAVDLHSAPWREQSTLRRI